MIRMREIWSMTPLVELVNFTRLDGIRLLEVGSYAGESAEVFASLPAVSAVWCIDPFLAGYDGSDVASASDFTEVEAAFDRVVARHPDKIRKFKGTLREFQIRHANEPIDLAYIDAKHQYEAVKDDIAVARLFSPRFIAGHDYSPCWAGVVKAVNEAVGVPDRIFVDSSWIKRVGG